MRKKKRNRHDANSTFIIVLAYANRYFYPLLILLFLSFGKLNSNYIPTGISILAFSAYELIGVLCKWKHIFCSFQNAYHQKMTPKEIDWEKISKIDAYGIPCIFAIWGILLLLL